MKQFIFCIIAVVIMLFTNCTVNEKTGLIQVQNKTLGPLNNVKIGDKIISSYTASGSTVNYWYYESLTGNLTVDSLSLKKEQEDCILNLKPGYWVYITAEYDSREGDDVVSVSVYNSDSVQVQSSEWRDN